MPKKSARKSRLEKEFEGLCDTIGEQINQHIKDAVKSLQAATDLADQHGIPFFSKVSELGQSYIPDSFSTKWSGLDKDFVANMTEVITDELSYPNGWTSSQIC